MIIIWFISCKYKIKLYKHLLLYNMNLLRWRNLSVFFTTVSPVLGGIPSILQELSKYLVNEEASIFKPLKNFKLLKKYKFIVSFIFWLILWIIFSWQLKDCNVIATKLVLILDDLLWVLTDSQLKAMVQYAKSLSEAIEKSTEQRKSMAPEPTQVCY